MYSSEKAVFKFKEETRNSGLFYFRVEIALLFPRLYISHE